MFTQSDESSTECDDTDVRPRRRLLAAAVVALALTVPPAWSVAAEAARATPAAAPVTPPAATTAATARTGVGPARAIARLSPALEALARRTTWRPGCPVPLSALRQVTVPYLDRRGVARTGVVVVHQDVAAQAHAAFLRLYRQRFPITSITPIEYLGGDDDRSMAADNTSGFNCRSVPGTTTPSRHSWGKAVDVNPLENPYVTARAIMPPAGAAYRVRTPLRPAMIGPAQAGAFAGDRFHRGWTWGGTWTSSKDYQHFEHR